jgi:hypothetical protein
MAINSIRRQDFILNDPFRENCGSYSVVSKQAIYQFASAWNALPSVDALRESTSLRFFLLSNC